MIFLWNLWKPRGMMYGIRIGARKKWIWKDPLFDGVFDSGSSKASGTKVFCGSAGAIYHADAAGDYFDASEQRGNEHRYFKFSPSCLSNF